MNSHESTVVARLAAAGEDDTVLSQVYILLSDQCSPSITVLAPDSWLSRVPYFGTRMSSSQPPFVFALDCTVGSTPDSYLQCLRFLSSSPRNWLLNFKSVADVLQILPAADHLLFQECWDVCMGFLASSPWSIHEEDDIRATISELNMAPSPDVEERLDKSYDEAFLQTLILDMASTSASVQTWCEKWLNHSSASFAKPLQSILLKVMRSASENAGSDLPSEWFALAKCVLQYSDADHFIVQLVNSEKLLQGLVRCEKKHKMDADAIFKHVLEKVATRAVLLSNLQREQLLRWSGFIHPSNPKDLSYFDKLRLMVAGTVPINNAGRLGVMKSSCYDAVLKRMEHITHRFSRTGVPDLEMVQENI